MPAEPAQPAAGGGLFSNPWVLGGIGAAALALIGLLFARRRKKEEPAPDFGGGDSAADDHGGYFPAERVLLICPPSARASERVGAGSSRRVGAQPHQ